MRERAAEVGGSLHVSATDDGSLIRALLPLGPASPSRSSASSEDAPTR
jgi:hypothetical protein